LGDRGHGTQKARARSNYSLFGAPQLTDQDHKSDPRVASFKLLAETAQRMADKAESEIARADYLRIADEWRRLATEIENSKG
jgi:hypothetical protein